MVLINSLRKNEQSSTKYIINDEYTQNQIQQLRHALDETIGNKTLNLNYYTLHQSASLTRPKLAWFEEVTKTLKYLDERLEFKLIPRTSTTVQLSYNQRNVEMTSFFWSPDYHNIRTWTSFWFSHDYTVANLWINLYYELSNKNKSQYEPWQNKLREFLEKTKLSENTDHVSDNYPNHYFQSFYALQKIDSLNHARDIATDYKDNFVNVIGKWIDEAPAEETIGLVEWMDKQAAMLPWISQGRASIRKSLVRNGFHTPNNDFSERNYREWFYDGLDALNKEFRYWVPIDPFATNKTPYNASFNEAPNSSIFQSTYNGLTDWKMLGDWEWDQKNNTWKAPEYSFNLSSASQLVIKDKNDNQIATFSQANKAPLTKNSNVEDFILYKAGDEDRVKQKTAKVTKYIFTINPNRFKWYNYQGETNNYITAADFFWGLIGYILSCDLKINRNSYFLGLMDINILETLKANSHFFTLYNNNIQNEAIKYKTWNLKPIQYSEITQNNKDQFTIILNEPNTNLLDLLSKQFFQPIPIANQKVKDIFAGPDSYYNVDFNNGNISNLDIEKVVKLYGAGNSFKSYIDWWSPGPYYVSSASEQDITFKLNKNYFDQFPNEMFGDRNKKIGKIVMKYGNSFSEQLTYTQFITNELDLSTIPLSKIEEAAVKYKQHFRLEGVYNINTSDYIAFNTNVIEKDSDLIDYKVWNDSYPLDRRVYLDDGSGPFLLKSNVTINYFDAIVKDFHVFDGNSYKIRKAIIDSIDWYSLAQLASPGNTAYFQNSLIPYGNFRLNLSDDKYKYASYYELCLNEKQIGLTRNNLWSIIDYENHWKSQFKK